MKVWWRLTALAGPGWARLLLSAAAGTAALGSAVGLMAVSAWLISRAAQHPPVLTLMVAIVAVRAFGISRGVFRYAERLLGHDAAFRMLADLRGRVYEKLTRLAPAGLPAFRRGDLLARLVGDVDTLQDAYLRVAIPALVALTVGGGSVALAWALLPAAGAVLLAALAVAGLGVPWLSTRLARRAERRVAGLRGELTAGTVELLQGAPELLAYGALDARLAALAGTDRRLTAASARSAFTGGAGAAVSALALGAAVWAALALGVSAVRAGALAGVALAVVTLLPLAAFEAVAALPQAVQRLPRVGRAADRVFAVLDAPDPVADPARPAALPPGPYTLRVRGLRARWSPDGPDVLRGVDLDLRPGERVALVGPSGAGKSTLAAVLLRFLDPTGGQVTVNGVDLTTLSGDQVRGVIGWCAQDAHVFDTTLEENLRLARRDATPDQLRDALRRARLLDWVESLPHGLGTRVGEHGAALSGGQRQRLALARALLADFPILVLDEPTEHLDRATADAIIRDLLAARADRAVLLITHRLTDLPDADRILVLDAGRVVRQTTPARCEAPRPGCRPARAS